MRRAGKNGNGTRPPTLGGRKPNPILRARKAAEFFVKIAKEYEEAADGYRSQLYQFAERCYGIGLEFMDDLDEFHRFMAQEYWANVRQKPKDDQIMKAVLTFAMNADTPQKRTKVIKIAMVLDHCAGQPEAMGANEVANYISEKGGIEKLYNELTGHKNKGKRVPDDLELLKQPADEAEDEEPEDEEESNEWPQTKEEPDDAIDEPNVLRKRAVPKNARLDKGEITSRGTPPGENDGFNITDSGGVASPPKAPSLGSRFDESKHLLVDISELGMTPQAAMELKKLVILAVVGEPDEYNFQPIIATSVKQAARISGLWKKGEGEDNG